MTDDEHRNLPVPVLPATQRAASHDRRATQAARRAQAVELRAGGATYAQIGAALGIGEPAAYRLVSRALARDTHGAVAELRATECGYLDQAQAAIWGQVLAGDLAAVETFVRLSARRSRLLGLDAPATLRLDLQVRTELDAALAELEALVLGDDDAT